MAAIDFEQLQIVFEAASRSSGRERSDFIEQLDRDNPSLATEVRSLLRFHGDEEDPLERASESWRATRVNQDQQHVPLPTIQGYAMERRIGSGGQADVFLARQESTGQDVAIKVFRGYGLVESQRHRIDSEAKALVRLQLTNVVAILDRGQTTDGREYLVTRYVAGASIDQATSQFLAENLDDIANLFAKVAETLARVHRHGIIHRDLKPSNILVDQDHEPYLLDFGLASFFADPSGRLLTATPDCGFQGSILWASPEQVDASFGPVDHRSDIYSLGVVLYQSLTGGFPYPVEGGILDVAQQIVRTPPTALSASTHTSNRLWVPELETVVFRALDKQPHRRYQSADELAAALRSLREAAPQPYTPLPQPHRSPLSRFALFGGATAACAALWFGLNATVFSVPESSKQGVTSEKDVHSPLVIESNAAETEATGVPLAESFDDELAEFGMVPTHWSRVGDLQNNHHEIERSNVRIDGDFVLALQASADRATRAGFHLTLVGSDGSDDLTISGEKVNTWSDNESWEFQTPSGTVLRGLPVSSHTFSLKRQGEVVTLTADAVYRPDRNEAVLATFAAGERLRFKAIRLATTGSAIKLERSRLHTTGDHR